MPEKKKRKHGVLGQWLRGRRVGDKVAAVVEAVPGLRRVLPCYDAKGNLKPDSGCGKRKKDWNGET